LNPNRELHARWTGQLDELGVEGVRIRLTSNVYIPDIDREFAWKWLRQRDEENRSSDRRLAVWTLALLRPLQGLRL
jgi:hypothetical protein